MSNNNNNNKPNTKDDLKDEYEFHRLILQQIVREKGAALSAPVPNDLAELLKRIINLETALHVIATTTEATSVEGIRAFALSKLVE